MTARKETILVVDDEFGVRQVLSMLLKTEGFDVIEAANGKECLRLAYEHRPDLVLLDIMMPDRDGREVCRRLREISDVPIVMLTALSDVKEKVDRLGEGADDFISKPFQSEELIARIRAHLRRASHNPGTPPRAYHDGRLDVDFEARRLTVNGSPVSLPPKQWRLLECLINHRDRAVTYDELLHYAWGDGFAGERRYVKVYISHLRQRIGDSSHRPRYIHTERDLGYRFESHV